MSNLKFQKAAMLAQEKAAGSYNVMKEIFFPEDTPAKVFFYHGECIDGAAALWSAFKKFGDSTAYVPLVHSSANEVFENIANHINKDSEITFADFAPSPTVMNRILGVIGQGKGTVKVIDHHETPIKQYKDVPSHPKVTLILDNKRAGGRMVYDELYNDGKPTPDDQLPQIVKIAEVLDLNQREYGDFKEISAFVDEFKLTNAHRAYLVAKMVNDTDKDVMVERGKILYADEQEKVARLFEQKSKTISLDLPEIATKPVSVVIVPACIKDYSRHFDNEMVRQARQMGCELAMSYYNDNDSVRVSIRRTNNQVDLSVIGDALGSRGIGGGGRESAAAARFTPEQFQQTFGMEPQKNERKFVVTAMKVLNVLNGNTTSSQPKVVPESPEKPKTPTPSVLLKDKTR